MPRTILVPTDFSKNARVAAKYAVGFARYSNYKVHFLHAFQPLKSAFQTRADNEKELEEAKMEARENMAGFQEDLGTPGEVEAFFEVSHGDLIDCLDKFIREEPVAFIVMGTHGASGPRKDILGSNTYDVATSVSVPLVIVPERSSGFNLERIVFFTDYQKGDVQTLEAFKDIAAASEKPCTLVHILEETSEPEPKDQQQLEEWKKRLQEETGYAGLKTELVVGDENIHIVNHIIERLEADLTLVTLTKEGGFLDRLFYKSLAKAIVLNPETPVLLTSAKK